MTAKSSGGDFRRGVLAAVTAWVLLALSLLPSRLAVAMRVRGGTTFERATRALAGTLLDFAHASWLVAPVLVILVLAAVAVPALRRRAMAWGAVLAVMPCAVALYLVTVTEQEVKAERGAFSTLREMLDAAAEPSFIEGAPGFIRYQRILLPAVLCGGAFLVVLALRLRRGAREEAAAPARWSVGLVVALVVGALGARASARVVEAVSPRLSLPRVWVTRSTACSRAPSTRCVARLPRDRSSCSPIGSPARQRSRAVLRAWVGLRAARSVRTRTRGRSTATWRAARRPTR